MKQALCMGIRSKGAPFALNPVVMKAIFYHAQEKTRDDILKSKKSLVFSG